MKYIEMTIEEAIKHCCKNQKVLVAIHDLENSDINVPFVAKRRSEYMEIFSDIKTAISIVDDFTKQLRLFTEKQRIPHIERRGIEKIVLLKEF